MDVSLIIKQIEKKGWGSYKKSGMWLNMSCPFSKDTHEKKKDEHFSFGINIEGQGRYFCFTCGKSGFLKELFDDLPLLTLLINGHTKIQKQKDIIYPEKFLFSFDQVYDHPYLDKRGVSIKVREMLDFHYDWCHHRICVPVRNFEKKLVGVVGRSLVSMPKYYFYGYNGEINSHLLLGENWVDVTKPIILVEGLFDVCRVLEVKRNVLGTFGTQLSNQKLKRIEKFPYIISIYDNDIAGNKAREKVLQFFGKKKVTHLFLPKEYKDPGETPVEVLQEIFSKKIPLLS